MMSGVVGIAQSAANVPDIFGSAAERSEQLNRTGAAVEAERTEQKPEPEPLSGQVKPNTDLFVHSEESQSAGLSEVSRDEEGNLKIIFDAPGQKASEAAEEADPSEQALEENEAADEDGEDGKKGDGITIAETTGNCDKVEAEIKKLKQEKAKLSQEMQACADNPDKQQEMQKRLQQLESELRVKDTDEYRNLHTVITSQRIVKRANE